MDIAKIGNRKPRRKNVKLYEIEIPAQTVRIEATNAHVAWKNMFWAIGGYKIREVQEDENQSEIATNEVTEQ